VLQDADEFLAAAIRHKGKIVEIAAVLHAV
jgi:hypothetical protein